VLPVFGVPPRSRGEDHPLIRAVGIAWVLENDYHDHDDHDGDVSGMTTDIWTVAEAKARLSEVIEQATANGPQTITKRGRTAAVVVSAEEWDRKTRRKGNLAEFFAASPLRGSGLSIARKKDRPRKVEL
jgi:prevent-host-death family protein